MNEFLLASGFFVMHKELSRSWGDSLPPSDFMQWTGSKVEPMHQTMFSIAYPNISFRLQRNVMLFCSVLAITISLGGKYVWTNWAFDMHDDVFHKR